MTERQPGSHRFGFWPWAVLALAAIPAPWYVLDYEDDIDPELPGVVRPTFSRYPPAAYRFAEAGDTIDHIAVYISSAALVLAGWGVLRNPRERAWWAAAAVSAAGFWHAATPGPLVDGWYGLGWRTIFDPRAPAPNRLILSGLAAAVTAIVAWALMERRLRTATSAARARGILGLVIVAALLAVMRQVGWLDVEPSGFWPRWMYVWALLAWALALLKVIPAAPRGWSRWAIPVTMITIWLGLDFAGRGLFWYQRPIHRLREMIPGRLYLSAMPTFRGLEIAQERHHFRSIFNLFPEQTPLQSPDWPDEMRFVREHGLKYIGNPSQDGSGGDEFVAETIKLASDPSYWPILVHCHASMDRSPAWVGIYRFAVQGWPLADVFREIELHRGLRPRGTVIILYNHILPRLAPDRCAQDPTFALLQKCAAGSLDSEARVAVRSEAERAADSASTAPNPRR
jgi:hypothetical protein